MIFNQMWGATSTIIQGYFVSVLKKTYDSTECYYGKPFANFAALRNVVTILRLLHNWVKSVYQTTWPMIEQV